MTNDDAPERGPEQRMERRRRWRWRGPQSLTGRILLAAGLWLALAMVVGGLLLSFAFREAVERHFDARLSTLMDTLIGGSNVNGEGIVSLYRSMMDPQFDRPYSGWYWEIAAPGELPFRSRSLWDQDLAVDFAAHYEKEHFSIATGPEAQTLRVVARDIRLPGSERVYRFIVAIDVSEVEDQVSAFNRMLGWWLVALAAILLASMAIQVRYGLRPLRQISVALTAIRSGTRRRLEGDFPTEILPLVGELNALIDHNAAVVERAQKHVGNLAHALKTPLTVMTNEADLRQGPLADLVTRQTEIMRRHVDHHLARARAAARGSVIGSRTPVMPAIRDLVRVMERIYQDRNLTFAVTSPAGSDANFVFRGERQDLDEMLGNLLDNAGKWARSAVRVTVRSVGDEKGDRISIAVEDDGPGISPADRDLVFARGERIDEGVPGSGLGLGIVKDLSELCGGTIALENADDGAGGLKAILTLPMAMRG